MARQRKTLAEIKADLLARKKTLEAERLAKEQKLNARIAEVEAQEKTRNRKQDSHLKIIIGAAVMAHARIHPVWAKQLHDVLQLAVTVNAKTARRAKSIERDRELVAAWFARLAAESKPAPVQQPRAAA